MSVSRPLFHQLLAVAHLWRFSFIQVTLGENTLSSGCWTCSCDLQLISMLHKFNPCGDQQSSQRVTLPCPPGSDWSTERSQTWSCGCCEAADFSLWSVWTRLLLLKLKALWILTSFNKRLTRLAFNHQTQQQQTLPRQEATDQKGSRTVSVMCVCNIHSIIWWLDFCGKKINKCHVCFGGKLQTVFQATLSVLVLAWKLHPAIFLTSIDAIRLFPKRVTVSPKWV